LSEAEKNGEPISATPQGNLYYTSLPHQIISTTVVMNRGILVMNVFTRFAARFVLFKRFQHVTSMRFFCPYCGSALVKAKERNHFDVLKCKKKHCHYRHDIRLRLDAIQNGASPESKSYIYRSFKMKLTDLQLTRPNKPKIDFACLRHSAVALALTFHIHFGLSLRETENALLSLYKLPVSHQTIANWCQSVAYLLESQSVLRMLIFWSETKP